MRERCVKIFLDGFPNHLSIDLVAFKVILALEAGGFIVNHITIGDQTYHNPKDDDPHSC